MNPFFIFKYGASGDYTGCVDLAYRKAIDDHVDVLDCLVQLAKDGLCLDLLFFFFFFVSIPVASYDD